MNLKSFQFLIAVASIIAIIVISVFLIFAEPATLSSNKISIGIMLLVFGLNSLFFLIFLKKGNPETSLKNLSLKRAFLIIIAVLSSFSMIWASVLIVNSSFEAYFLHFISSASLLAACIIALRNLKRKKH